MLKMQPEMKISKMLLKMNSVRNASEYFSTNLEYLCAVDVKYYDLPAGLIVPLVQMEDTEYQPIDPNDVKLPSSYPVDECLIKACDDFYRNTPQDSMGWGEGALDEYLETKQQIREKRLRAFVQMQMSQRRKSRSLSPKGSDLARFDTKHRARSLSPSALIAGKPSPVFRSDSCKHLSRSRKRIRYYRSRAVNRRFLSPSEPDHDIVAAHLHSVRSRSYGYRRKRSRRSRSPSPPAVPYQQTRRSSPPVSSYRRIRRSSPAKDFLQKRRVSRWSSQYSPKKAKLLAKESKWDDDDDDVKITSAPLLPPTPPCAVPPSPVVETRLGEDNKGHQLLKKMGWSGKGLGVEEQGRMDPVESAAVRGQADKFSGLGINLKDRYSQIHKHKGQPWDVNLTVKNEEREMKFIQELCALETMKTETHKTSINAPGVCFSPCLFSTSAANETQNDNQEITAFKVPLQPPIKVKPKAKVKVQAAQPSLCADGTSQPGVPVTCNDSPSVSTHLVVKTKTSLSYSKLVVKWKPAGRSCPVLNCSTLFFTSRDDFEKHWKGKHHEYLDTYQCPVCEYQSLNISDVQDHVRSDHTLDDPSLLDQIRKTESNHKNPAYLAPACFVWEDDVGKIKEREQPVIKKAPSQLVPAAQINKDQGFVDNSAVKSGTKSAVVTSASAQSTTIVGQLTTKPEDVVVSTGTPLLTKSASLPAASKLTIVPVTKSPSVVSSSDSTTGGDVATTVSTTRSATAKVSSGSTTECAMKLTLSTLTAKPTTHSTAAKQTPASATESAVVKLSTNVSTLPKIITGMAAYLDTEEPNIPFTDVAEVLCAEESIPAELPTSAISEENNMPKKNRTKTFSLKRSAESMNITKPAVSKQSSESKAKGSVTTSRKSVTENITKSTTAESSSESTTKCSVTTLTESVTDSVTKSTIAEESSESSTKCSVTTSTESLTKNITKSIVAESSSESITQGSVTSAVAELETRSVVESIDAKIVMSDPSVELETKPLVDTGAELASVSNRTLNIASSAVSYLDAETRNTSPYEKEEKKIVITTSPAGEVVCPIAFCDGKTYNTVRGYNRHWNDLHRSKYPAFACPSCSMTSKQLPEVIKHIKKLHNDKSLIDKILRRALPNNKHQNPGHYIWIDPYVKQENAVSTPEQCGEMKMNADVKSNQTQIVQQSSTDSSNKTKQDESSTKICGSLHDSQEHKSQDFGTEAMNKKPPTSEQNADFVDFSEKSKFEDSETNVNLVSKKESKELNIVSQTPMVKQTGTKMVIQKLPISEQKVDDFQIPNPKKSKQNIQLVSVKKGQTFKPESEINMFKEIDSKSVSKKTSSSDQKVKHLKSSKTPVSLESEPASRSISKKQTEKSTENGMALKECDQSKTKLQGSSSEEAGTPLTRQSVPGSTSQLKAKCVDIREKNKTNAKTVSMKESETSKMKAQINISEQTCIKSVSTNIVKCDEQVNTESQTVSRKSEQTGTKISSSGSTVDNVSSNPKGKNVTFKPVVSEESVKSVLLKENKNLNTKSKAVLDMPKITETKSVSTSETTSSDRKNEPSKQSISPVKKSPVQTKGKSSTADSASEATPVKSEAIAKLEAIKEADISNTKPEKNLPDQTSIKSTIQKGSLGDKLKHKNICEAEKTVKSEATAKSVSVKTNEKSKQESQINIFKSEQSDIKPAGQKDTHDTHSIKSEATAKLVSLGKGEKSQIKFQTSLSQQTGTKSASQVLSSLHQKIKNEDLCETQKYVELQANTKSVSVKKSEESKPESRTNTSEQTSPKPVSQTKSTVGSSSENIILDKKAKPVVPISTESEVKKSFSQEKGQKLKTESQTVSSKSEQTGTKISSSGSMVDNVSSNPKDKNVAFIPVVSEESVKSVLLKENMNLNTNSKEVLDMPKITETKSVLTSETTSSDRKNEPSKQSISSVKKSLVQTKDKSSTADSASKALQHTATKAVNVKGSESMVSVDKSISVSKVKHVNVVSDVTSKQVYSEADSKHIQPEENKKSKTKSETVSDVKKHIDHNKKDTKSSLSSNPSVSVQKTIKTNIGESKIKKTNTTELKSRVHASILEKTISDQTDKIFIPETSSNTPKETATKEADQKVSKCTSATEKGSSDPKIKSVDSDVLPKQDIVELKRKSAEPNEENVSALIDCTDTLVSLSETGVCDDIPFDLLFKLGDSDSEPELPSSPSVEQQCVTMNDKHRLETPKDDPYESLSDSEPEMSNSYSGDKQSDSVVERNRVELSKENSHKSDLDVRVMARKHVLSAWSGNGQRCPAVGCSKQFLTECTMFGHWCDVHVETLKNFFCGICSFEGRNMQSLHDHWRMEHDVVNKTEVLYTTEYTQNPDFIHPGPHYRLCRIECLCGAIQPHNVISDSSPSHNREGLRASSARSTHGSHRTDGTSSSRENRIIWFDKTGTVCPIDGCQRAFFRNYRIHWLKYHEKLKALWICPNCDDFHPNLWSLKEHLKLRHAYTEHKIQSMLSRYQFKKKHVRNNKYIDPGCFVARFAPQYRKARQLLVADDATASGSVSSTLSESVDRHSRFASDDKATTKVAKDDRDAALNSDDEDDMMNSDDKEFELTSMMDEHGGDLGSEDEIFPDEMDVVC
ncbi:serine-rich adhesin for platelets-like [Gigantopelta aegis]|uniref:serine-rich adhesin for platelets-like n=1 Tax=Gigantopelta aegis TaxID=1735272 RepID=UPI001B8897BF|nr:serine-rich adhesin for platelets-like [Gigantopelta aegis]